MKKQSLVFILVLASILNPSNSWAQEPTVEECVQACDQALQKADLYIDSLQKEIVEREYLRNVQSKQIEMLKLDIEQRDVWYRQPLVIGLLGVLAGGILFNRK